MHVLILGGSPRHFGGVETFCSRAIAALGEHAPDIDARHGGTYTAYLRPRTLPQMVRGMVDVVRFRAEGGGLVWLQWVNLPDLAYILLARMLGLRVLVTPHLGSNWRSQRSGLLRGLSRWLLGRAHAIALLAPTQAEEVALPANVAQTAITTFLPAAILAPMATPTHDGPLRLLHAARLSREKGSFRAVEVAAGLKERRVPFTLEIAGSADENTFAALRRSIAEAGLEAEVTLTGWIDPDRLSDRLRQSDVLVHLSTIDSYPLIVLEALACGMFPLVLDLAGARDIVGRFDGVVVPQDDAVPGAVDALAATSTEELRARGRAQMQPLRDRLGWPAATAQLAGSLRETARAAPQRLPAPSRA
ncbi:glycosyltransferase family 4 protein [Croceibacterium sp. TMG7-5b_MA50]|uniref:glycosyltransferase family 4 protein n=1 Tax=Croceibacterium sp. TMG7-5b_MA50 TaxID=3121290 RepID=UPI0032220126